MIDTALLLTTSGKLSSEKLKQLSQEQKDFLLSSTQARSLAEAVYLAHYGIAPGTCELCGNVADFKSFRAGYRRFCSTKCSANSTKTQIARKNTCLAKYGVEHVSQSPEVKQKTIDTCLTRYGVEHHLQNPEVLQKRAETNKQRYGGTSPNASADIKQKIKNTNLARYNAVAPMGHPVVRDKTRVAQIKSWLPSKLEKLSETVTPVFDVSEYSSIETPVAWKCVDCGHEFLSHLKYGKTPRCYKCYPAHISKGEQEIADFITSLGFAVEQQNKTLIAPHHLDIVIPDKKICVEFNGIYYHSKHPKTYHLHKTQAAEHLGYQLLHVFEDEWRDKKSCIQNMLRSKLGVLQRIYARCCVVEQLNAHEESAFLTQHHLQGYTKSKVCYGLKYNGTTVAVMSFRRPRFTKNAEWELLRYASSATIVGGASKLLSVFEKQNLPQSLISYADRRWSTGNLYRTLGFDEQAPTPPGFYYTDYQRRYNRMNFQKHKLANKVATFDPALTEEANMNANGYYRIYDSGHRVFVKQ